MMKHPVLLGVVGIALISVTFAALDAVVILSRPVWPWFAWMLP